jgi:heme exporter protein B
MNGSLWWIIHKDLVTEFRARQAWPAMILLGLLMAVVFAAQMELLPEQKSRIVGALLWLAVAFAGLQAIDRTCAAERSDGCWDGLVSFPVSPGIIYWSKFLGNVLLLGVLECLLLPLFSVLSNVDLCRPLWAMSLLAVLTNFSFCAIGTLLSAVSNGTGRGRQLLVLLFLPLAIPVILAAADATQAIALGQLDRDYWRWIQLLGCFTVIFLTAGTVLFEFITEE